MQNRVQYNLPKLPQSKGRSVALLVDPVPVPIKLLEKGARYGFMVVVIPPR
jgi:hypothetical protein